MADFFEGVLRRQIARVGGLKIVSSDEEACLRALKSKLKGDLFFWSPPLERPATFSAKKSTKHHRLFKEGVGETPFTALAERLKESEETKLSALVFCGVDAYLEGDPQEQRAFLELTRESRKKGLLCVIVSRSADFPPALREITVLYQPLPDMQESKEELQAQLHGEPFRVVDEDAFLSVLRGLTLTQQADALSLAKADALLAGKKELSLDVVRTYKENEIGKYGFLQIVEPTKTFADLKGHAFFKSWCADTQKAFSSKARDAGVNVPKGAMLVGPPGTGKSRIAEALAQDWGMPLLSLDVGAVFSKWQGESEAQMREALAIAERLAPCILLVDEVERYFNDGRGENDGGSSDRITGKLLSWLSTKEAPVFVLFTANFPQRLPAAMIRKGRIDEVFFMDFPTEEERAEIIRFYYGKEAPPALCERLKGYAPAEIEALIADAKKKAFGQEREVTEEDVDKEVTDSVPLSKFMADDIEIMREWGQNHARSTVDGKRNG